MSFLPEKKLSLTIALLVGAASSAQAITVDELAAQFEAYKKQQDVRFNQLIQENQTLKTQNQELKSQMDSTQQQVQNNTEGVEIVSESYIGASSIAKWIDKTSIGGYGELHYQNRSIENGVDKEEINFHRFVLFFGHEFTDNLRFISELELEHSIAGVGENGKIELEQAYFEYDLTENATASAGMFLIPVGIINETHEPTTFYGVERNEVEQFIIPTTWREAGIGANYRFDNGLSIDAAVTSGLDVGDNFYIRGGRQNISKQKANDPILVARAKYTGIPGLELAATILHQTDMAQSDNSRTVGGVDIGSGTLYETHAIYKHAFGPGVFTGKALYSRWNININAGDQAAETQYGWYLEPSYRVPTPIGDVGVYGRYQKLDYFKGSDKNFNIWEAGANWWLHENVVLKANYIYKEDVIYSNRDESGFDLGLGYQF